jgi:hypothetical protein
LSALSARNAANKNKICNKIFRPSFFNENTIWAFLLGLGEEGPLWRIPSSQKVYSKVFKRKPKQTISKRIQ